MAALYSRKQLLRPDDMPADAAPPPTDWRALPKVLLHEHLDGGLRAATLLELLPRARPGRAGRRRRGAGGLGAGQCQLRQPRTLPAPASSSRSRPWPRCGPASAWPSRPPRMRWPTAACWPSSASRRCCWRPSACRGEAVVEALLAGLRRSALPCGLIVCAMRHRAARAHAAQRAAGGALRGPRRDRLRPGRGRGSATRPPTTPRAFAVARDAGLGADLPCRRGRCRRARARGRGAGRDAHRPRHPHRAGRRRPAARARVRPAFRGLPEQQRAHRRRGVAGQRTRSARCWPRACRCRCPPTTG